MVWNVKAKDTKKVKVATFKASWHLEKQNFVYYSYYEFCFLNADEG